MLEPDGLTIYSRLSIEEEKKKRTSPQTPANENKKGDGLSCSSSYGAFLQFLRAFLTATACRQWLRHSAPTSNKGPRATFSNFSCTL